MKKIAGQVGSMHSRFDAASKHTCNIRPIHR